MPHDPDLENLSLLLPFYVNGTLDAVACARVDAALATSEELREELAEIGRLAQGVKTGGRDLGQGDNVRVERVAAKLAHGATPAPLVAPSQKLSGMLAFLNPRSWHPAVALSLAVAAVAQATQFLGHLAGFAQDQRSLHVTGAAQHGRFPLPGQHHLWHAVVGELLDLVAQRALVDQAKAGHGHQQHDHEREATEEASGNGGSRQHGVTDCYAIRP